MLRKLIALLVLVTGLAAIGQPAQASAADLQSAGFALSASSNCASQAGARAGLPASGTQRAVVPQRACPKPPVVVVIVPTVMLRVDRARE